MLKTWNLTKTSKFQKLSVFQEMTRKGIEDFESKRKDKTMRIAAMSAVQYAAAGGTTALLGTLYASKYYEGFNRYMSISAKSSLPVMAALFIFGLQFELKMHDVQLHPKKYGIDAKNQYVDPILKPSGLPYYQRAMNYCHDNPFLLVAGLGFPFVGAILNQQLQIKHLTLSQRIMHSRVLGQAGVLTIAMSVMAFKDYMDKRGKFEEFNAAEKLES